MKDLFKECHDDGSILELIEDNYLQLATLFEDLHSDDLVSTLNRITWNSVHAQLSCKYLMHNYVKQYLYLVNQLLSEYTGLNVFVKFDKNPAANGLYHYSGTHYKQSKGSYIFNAIESSQELLFSKSISDQDPPLVIRLDQKPVSHNYQHRFGSHHVTRPASHHPIICGRLLVSPVVQVANGFRLDFMMGT